MIRKHKEEDIDQIMHVWQSSSTVAHPFLNKTFVDKVTLDMRNLYIPNSETWVYEQEGSIVGFISMMGNEIAGLFVLPNTQSKGIGTSLVDLIAKEHKVLEVEVFEKNTIGRSFYKKYGFKQLNQYAHKESGQLVLRLQSN